MRRVPSPIRATVEFEVHRELPSGRTGNAVFQTGELWGDLRYRLTCTSPTSNFQRKR